MGYIISYVLVSNTNGTGTVSKSTLKTSAKTTSGQDHFRLCPLALARPLPRVPRTPPLALPPLAPGPGAPRLDDALMRDAGTGVWNLGGGFDDVGGLSTKDVSVVLLKVKRSIRI